MKLVWRLLESADILIEGFRPGVMERLGLGPDAVALRNARLVYGRVTGWGAYGPPAWQRGAKLIELDLAAPRPLPRHREVF